MTNLNLRISTDHRHLCYADGSPFFYLGDTAWELFHVLTVEEAAGYFDDRAAKQFTVIQAVLVSEFEALTWPNAYGELPFRHNDPTQPNEAYFRTADAMIAAANARGLIVGVLPTWGGYVSDTTVPGRVIFSEENARVYGRFLGARYRDAGVIWIVGGDRPAPGFEPVWRALAAGLSDGDGGRHLRTYHPNGCHSSAQWLHAEEWLDFNMIQSCHVERDAPNDAMIARDLLRTPLKPVLDGEPCYEGHPVNWKPELGVFTAYDARRAAWRGVFAGACGHTYGAHGVFQFTDPARRCPLELSPWLAGLLNSARHPWREALQFPGAAQMQHLRTFAETHPFMESLPAPALLGAPGAPNSPTRALARSTADGTWIALYAPTPNALTVHLPVAVRQYCICHLDPATGEYSAGHQLSHSEDTNVAIPAPAWAKEDWVAVLRAGN